MKKLLTILVLMLCGFSVEVSAKSETPDWKDCYDAATFATLVKANADIRLKADINLSSLKEDDDDYLFECTFSGRIDGTNGNPEIYNGRHYALTSRQSSAGKAITLFEKMDGAEITNLNIYQCDFEGLDTESGLLCETCYNSTFDNMMFGDCKAVGDHTGYDSDRMGFVAGYAENSKFRNFFFTECTMITDGSKLGLIAGEAKNCEFTLCSSNMLCELWGDGNVTSDNSAYVGGFCGYGDNCTFSQCYNFGAVMSDDDCIGGIIGFGTNCKIEDCKNVGNVIHCKKEGFGRRNYEMASISLLAAGGAMVGIGAILYIAFPAATPFYGNLGQLFEMKETGQIAYWQYLYAKDMIVNGAYMIPTVGFTAFVASVGVPAFFIAGAACLAAGAGFGIYCLNDPDEMGGIAGTLEGGSSVLRCWNGGTIECGDEDCGGIVGYLDGSSVEGCYNRTFVKSYGKNVGGIVGTCKNGTVTHNLNVGVVYSKDTPMDYIVGNTEGDCTIKSNHYLSEEEKADDSRAFTQEALPSGQIALTMNNELIAEGKDPIWRQKLGEDFNPANFDESRPIVESTTTNYSLWQSVTTAEEFYYAVSNPLAKVSIEADLNLNSYVFNLATQAHPFKGEIKGNGHTIKNCHYATTDEYVDGNCALFPYAWGAKFEDLILDGISISPLNSIAGDLEDMAILVAHSTDCEYNNITLRNCNILVNSDEDRLRKIAGLVCHSNYDKITDCTIESTCEFQSHVYVTSTADSYVAGFAATAIGSKFLRCHNAAKIKADDDRVAGIVADAKFCMIEKCLNSGQIIGQGELGGIAGYAASVGIYDCVNVGGIDNDDEDHDKNRGGIVGYITKSTDTEERYTGTTPGVMNNFNYGYINWAYDEGKSGSGCIAGGRTDDAGYTPDNHWYCQFNGTYSTNSADNNSFYNDLLSGRFAYSNDYYQSIDNHNDFCTTMPVALPAAGTVYSNILCDGTQSYSNIYHSTEAHTPEADQYGKCALCGKTVGDMANTIHITDADGLTALANNVNSGMDLTGHTVCLDNDIDMQAVTDYTPIGKDFGTPFRGTFNGQGYRIKNLTVKRVEKAVGLFGVVSGTTTIQNLVIDSSCKFTATGIAYGAAGIVGCVARASEDLSDPINVTLDRCANEANVTGHINAAGLIGGVYNTETNGNATVYINDCYNVGTIIGDEMSAALIGYGNETVNVTNCFNAGTVIGYESDHSLIRCKDYSKLTATNVYNLESVANDTKATTFTLKELTGGKLCSILQENAVETIWGQNIGTDYYPKFDEDGLRHERKMACEWGTLVLPFAVRSNDEIQFYQFDNVKNMGSEDVLVLTEVDEVAPSVPCFFKVLNDASVVKFVNNDGVLTTFEDAKSVEKNNLTLKGTYETKNVSLDAFVPDCNKLTAAVEGTSVAPFQAYLTGYNGSKNVIIYMPLSLSGDINGDGTVDVSDVTALVNVILGKDDSGLYDRTAADVNEDGTVDVSDVTALVNIILGK